MIKRALALFFLACSLSIAGNLGAWAPFPLDSTNNIYDKRILSNLVFAINERCAVVVGVAPIDWGPIASTFVTRPEALAQIDAKIDELIPLFVDRNFTNSSPPVYNDWYRKTDPISGGYNFQLSDGSTQYLPRLNRPMSLSNEWAGKIVWPLTNWQGQITNYQPTLTSDPDSDIYFAEAWWTMVPDKPVWSIIAEWRCIDQNESILLPGRIWIDARLNTIPNSPMNWTNYLSATYIVRPFPFQGRDYSYTNPLVQWISTNATLTPVNGTLSGLAYVDDGGGDMYRQLIETNNSFSVTFPPQGGPVWPLASPAPAGVGLFLLQERSVPVNPVNLPNPAVAGVLPGDILRIWYDIDVTTYSGPEPYSGTSRGWANILWRECLNERYRVINGLRWTTPTTSGGSNYWECQTSMVASCDDPFGADNWPAPTVAFPVNICTGSVHMCPLPATIYTPPDYGVFPGWTNLNGTGYAATNLCAADYSTNRQYPRYVYNLSGSVTVDSDYDIITGIPTNYWDAEVLSANVVWYIPRLDTVITDDSHADIDFAASKPVVVVGPTVSNYAYQVDFYMYGSNSILAGIDDPEWVPLKTQTVNCAANTWTNRGQTVNAVMAPWMFSFPAIATSSIDADISCPGEVDEDYRDDVMTVIVTRASTSICDSQQVWLADSYGTVWTQGGSTISDIPDGGRTNRFETRSFYWNYFGGPYQTNIYACYYQITNFTLAQKYTISPDPEPEFSTPIYYTNKTENQGPWDDLAGIIGFYPTGQTRIIDGFVIGPDVQGDLYLTIAPFSLTHPPFGPLAYSNDIITEYHLTASYQQTEPALDYYHTAVFSNEYLWRDSPYPDTPIAVLHYPQSYNAQIAFSNSVTNAWIFQHEPLIRWDVPNGFQFK